MKFRNQARLFLVIYEFAAHIMLSLSVTFQGTGLSVWERFNKMCESLSKFSDFY